jgi:uncharacterized protein (DUF362 family)
MKGKPDRRELDEGSDRGSSCAAAAGLGRRDFLKKAGIWTGGVVLGGALAALAGCAETRAPVVRTSAPSSSPAPATGAVDLAAATGAEPGEAARRALEGLGGMGRFVKSGDMVVVKPNASFMDGPQAATSTNPAVVSQVVTMCREAGASRVVVLDHCLRGSADACLSGNGIGRAVTAAGGEMLAYDAGNRGHGVEAEVPGGVALKTVSVYPEVLEADVVITVPRAKHHGSAGLSLGMKNFIGVMTDMSSIHNHGLHQGIADLNSLVRPALSVVDASIILLDNGPGGPGPTHAANTVIASGDVVAADAFACSLFGRSPEEIEYIVLGNRAGLGEIDLNKLKIARV